MEEARARGWKIEGERERLGFSIIKIMFYTLKSEPVSAERLIYFMMIVKER